MGNGIITVPLTTINLNLHPQYLVPVHFSLGYNTRWREPAHIKPETSPYGHATSIGLHFPTF